MSNKFLCVCSKRKLIHFFFWYEYSYNNSQEKQAGSIAKQPLSYIPNAFSAQSECIAEMCEFSEYVSEGIALPPSGKQLR